MITEALKGLLSSKKFLMAVIGMALVLLGRLGIQLDADVVYGAISPLIAAIIGQGIADTGKLKKLDPPSEGGFVRTTLLLVMLPFAAIVAAAVLLTGGCAASKAGAKAAGDSFATCSAEAAKSAAAALDPVLGPLVIAAASAPDADLAPLRRVVGLLREDIRRCALEAVRDGILAFLAAAPRTHAQQLDPERVRAVVAEALEGAP
jgi:hypothetical protein